LKRSRFVKSATIASVLLLGLTLVSQDSRAAAHFQPLRSFGFPSQLGSQPEAPLILASDGILYGTTYGAANNFRGTVFKMNLDGTGYTVLYKFKLTDGDGRVPSAGLVEGKDGVLYGTAALGGAFGFGNVFKLNKDGTGYQVLHGFEGAPADGRTPHASLLEGSDGALYSTTFSGGDFNRGCIFRLNKDGSGYTILHSFKGSDGANPYAGLIEASDHGLYGTTTSGGNEGAGAIFTLGKDGANFALLYSFSTSGGDGQHPYGEVLEGSDGALYGSTHDGGETNAGTVFRLAKNGSNYMVLRRFIVGPPSPGNPFGQLLEGIDHALYGTSYHGGSNNAGTVFRITRDGVDFNIMHHFRQGDGYWPYAGLIEVGSTLYGTTQEGGAGRMGTAFRINEDASGYSLIHHFNFSGYDGYYPLALVQGSDDGIYGVTQTGGTNADGTLFKINPDGSGYTLLHDFSFWAGRVPFGLIQGRDGVLYGTTYQGGTNDGGVVYAINADGGAYTLLHMFGTNSMQGMNPSDALEASDGALYGTTHNGGSNSVGTVFRVTKQGDNCAVLHQFVSGTGDGNGPYAGLVEGSDLALYGVTYSGGAYQYGTVFRITTNGGAYQVLHGFGSGSDGAAPYGALIKGSDGMLYGTTFFGGTYQCGTVFKIDNNGGAYLVLHEFQGTTAYSANPAARLVEGPDGALYGTARHGGENNTGMIFKLSKDGSGYTQVHSFAIPPAAYEPDSGLVAARNGALYGSAYYGGDLGLGTLFRLWPAATPDMLSVDMFNGIARVSFAGEPSRQYQVLRSTNLTQWESLGILTMPDPGFVVYPDANPPALAAYYRAFWVR
jgi:uncharacterized repeat protein (TIGR03803 family)